MVRGGAGDPANAGSSAGERPDPTQSLGRILVRELADEVLFLFHRRVPGRFGDLPIVAVASTGVHLIEPRSYPGRRVRASRDGSAFVIDGVRHPAIAEAMADHGEALQAAVATGPLPTADMHAQYCFVDTDLPWRRLEVGGLRAVTPAQLVRRLRERGPLDEREVEALHRDLSRRLARM